MTTESVGSLRQRQWPLVHDGITATDIEFSGATVRMDVALPRTRW